MRNTGGRSNSIRTPERTSTVEIARVLILLERYDEAIATIATTVEWNKPRLSYWRCSTTRRVGKADADAALKRLASNSPEILDRVHLAEIYAFRGMNDEAFDLLIDFQAELERNQASTAACALVFPG